MLHVLLLIKKETQSFNAFSTCHRSVSIFLIDHTWKNTMINKNLIKIVQSSKSIEICFSMLWRRESNRNKKSPHIPLN